MSAETVPAEVLAKIDAFWRDYSGSIHIGANHLNLRLWLLLHDVRAILADRTTRPPAPTSLPADAETGEAVASPFAVLSIDSPKRIYLGSYETMEQAQKAQGGRPDRWAVFVPAHLLLAEKAAHERTAKERDELKRRLNEEFANMDATMQGWDKLCADADASEARAEAAEAKLSEETAARVAVEEALEAAAIWHDAQDKAISKQPNANSGHNGWMRNEHQEQAAALRAQPASHGDASQNGSAGR